MFALRLTLILAIAVSTCIVAADDPERGGLVAEYRERGGDHRVVRIEPLPRLYGHAGDAIHPTLVAGEVDVAFLGRLVVPHAGVFTFFANTEEVSDLNLELNGETIAWGKPVDLEAGSCEFSLTAVARRGARLWLEWESDRFAREAMHPRFFTRDSLSDDLSAAISQQASIDRGAVLAERGGCFRCHPGPAAWRDSFAAAMTPIEQLPGPNLIDTQDRLSRDWIERWIRDPHAVRPDHADAGSCGRS